MGWVTLDDGQKVLISGGKVLASRSKISSAGGAKERGKALAARSKAAIGNALAKQRNAIATGIGEWNKPGAETERSRLKREISQHLANREHTQAAQKSKRLTELEKKEGQSPAHPVPGARRAIEHAKAAGPTLREQAEQARAARQYPDTAGIKHTMTPGHRAERAEYLKDLRKEAMTGIPGKERTNSGQDIKYRLGVAMADMPAKSKYGAAYGSRGNVAAGRYKRTGQADSPATARAIEHAKAAGPVKTTRESGLVPRSEQATKEERLAAIVQRSRAREGVWKSNAPFRGDKLLPSKEEVKAEVTRQNREAGAQKVNATRATKTGETKEEYARRIRKEIMRSVRGSR